MKRKNVAVFISKIFITIFLSQKKYVHQEALDTEF